MSVNVQLSVDTEKPRPLQLPWRLKGMLSLTLIVFGLFFQSVNITKHLIKTTKTADMIMWPVFQGCRYSTQHQRLTKWKWSLQWSIVYVIQDSRKKESCKSFSVFYKFQMDL